MTVMGHTQAAEYLGIHPNTLRNRVVKGYVKAAKMENGELVYEEQHLRECMRDMSLRENETTIRMVAQEYGIDYHRVLRAFRLYRVNPTRKIGRLSVYSIPMASLVARREGWQ